MNKLFIRLLIIAAIFTAIPICLYAYFVGLPARFIVSDDSAQWASFGDFVGGTLGPLYALFAFIAVLITVHLQNRQIVDFKNRASLDELQRLLTTVSKNIDQILDKHPNIAPDNFRGNLIQLNIRLLLRGSGHDAIMPPSEDYIVTYGREKKIAAAHQSATVEFSELAVEFHQLVWCLQRFAELGGEQVLDAFYKNRYQNDVCYLHALGFITEDSRSFSYFDPINQRKFLI